MALGKIQEWLEVCLIVTMLMIATGVSGLNTSWAQRINVPPSPPEEYVAQKISLLASPYLGDVGEKWAEQHEFNSLETRFHFKWSYTGSYSATSTT